ncbi:hypothetical protein [Micrococcus luteus]|uniref:hypothetical protein n=1 Tax=Micrococcus luteus TaxID=1270 RepID=UPI0037FE10A1
MDANGIAAIAAVLAVAVALFIHWDSRGRARVDLRLAWWEGLGGRLGQRADGQFKRPPDCGPVIEFVQVGIENGGRQAVTVVDMGFEVRPRGGRRRYVQPSHFVSTQDTAHATSPRVHRRVEANDRHAVLFDLWTYVDHMFLDDAELQEVRLRGYVRVAGRRRRSFSRDSWTIWRNTYSALPDARRRELESAILTSIMVARCELEDGPLPLDLFTRVGHIAYEMARESQDLMPHDIGQVLAGAWPDDLRERLHDYLDSTPVEPDVELSLHWAFKARDHFLNHASRCRSAMSWPPPAPRRIRPPLDESGGNPADSG